MPTEEFSPQSDSSWQFVGSEDIRNAPSLCNGTPRSVPDNFFEMEDMALLHHWITKAGRSILDTHDLDHYWHSVIPSIGFKHQYVIHSILSLSALHVAHTRPPNRAALLHLAAEHRSKALDGFTEDLQNVSIDNSTALFANSSLTFFYAFASFSTNFDDDKADSSVRTTQVLGKDWISLVRGTSAVLHSSYLHVREGPLRSFVELQNFAELDVAECIRHSDFGARLQDIKRMWSVDEHAEVYNETLELLLRCSSWMEQFDLMTDEAQSTFGYNRFCSGPFIWLINAPERYIVLQQQRQPPALIIFAYYGVLLHRLNNYWWAEGCGRSIVKAAEACLGPYWSSLLDCPKQAVGLS